MRRRRRLRDGRDRRVASQGRRRRPRPGVVSRRPKPRRGERAADQPVSRRSTVSISSSTSRAGRAVACSSRTPCSPPGRRTGVASRSGACAAAWAAAARGTSGRSRPPAARPVGGDERPAHRLESRLVGRRPASLLRKRPERHAQPLARAPSTGDRPADWRARARTTPTRRSASFSLSREGGQTRVRGPGGALHRSIASRSTRSEAGSPDARARPRWIARHRRASGLSPDGEWVGLHQRRSPVRTSSWCGWTAQVTARSPTTSSATAAPAGLRGRQRDRLLLESLGSLRGLDVPARRQQPRVARSSRGREPVVSGVVA